MEKAFYKILTREIIFNINNSDFNIINNFYDNNKGVFIIKNKLIAFSKHVEESGDVIRVIKYYIEL